MTYDLELARRWRKNVRTFGSEPVRVQDGAAVSGYGYYGLSAALVQPKAGEWLCEKLTSKGCDFGPAHSILGIYAVTRFDPETFTPSRMNAIENLLGGRVCSGELSSDDGISLEGAKVIVGGDRGLLVVFQNHSAAPISVPLVAARCLEIESESKTGAEVK